MNRVLKIITLIILFALIIQTRLQELSGLFLLFSFLFGITLGLLVSDNN